jgi:hypothetical protein
MFGLTPTPKPETSKMSRTTKHEPTEEGIKIIPGELDDG